MGRLIRLDWAIKNILRQKANFGILEGLLSELLRFDVTIHEILESESNKQEEKAKLNRVDILVKNSEGELILVEIQNDSELDYLQRILFGSSKLVVEHIDQGNPYSKVLKVYTVSIVYFDLGYGEDYIYHGTTTFSGLRQGDKLTLNQQQREAYNRETPEGLFPEHYLIKIPKFDDKIRDSLDEWIFFLKNEKIKPEFKARGLQEASERLSILKLTEEERSSYEDYLEDLRYQASMVESSYGSGMRMGRREILMAFIQKQRADLGLDPMTEAALNDMMTTQLETESRELYDRNQTRVKDAEQAIQREREARKLAEQEKQRAEQEKQRAEQEKQQAQARAQDAEHSAEKERKAREQAEQATAREREIRRKLEEELAAYKKQQPDS